MYKLSELQTQERSDNVLWVLRDGNRRYLSITYCSGVVGLLLGAFPFLRRGLAVGVGLPVITGAPCPPFFANFRGRLKLSYGGMSLSNAVFRYRYSAP